MSNYSIRQGNKDDLDLIGPLWEKLNELHYNLSPHFKDRFREMTWEKRKQKLLEKSREMRIDYVVDNESNAVIGYCISTLEAEESATGELDSLYIDENHRHSGLGRQLVQRSIEWMDSRGATTRKLLVGVGNEQVLEFYEQFGFYPLHIVMQNVKEK